jgi:hypothetical protein
MIGRWLIGLLVPLALVAPARSCAEVVGMQAVLFQEPTLFWRDGKQVAVRDAVLVRVRVEKPLEFLPHGLGPPLFVFGAWIGETILSPLADGVARVLVPRPEGPGVPPLLWIAPAGVPPRELTKERLERTFGEVAHRTPGRVEKLPPLPDAQGAMTVRDLGALQQQQLQQLRQGGR